MDEKKRKPVIHVRVMAPIELAERVADELALYLEERYELLERSDPLPVLGYERKAKVYITIREQE